MSARLTRIFESNPLAAPVAPDLQAFVALAVKVTARPQDVTPQDVRAAYSAALSPRQYFDAYLISAPLPDWPGVCGVER